MSARWLLVSLAFFACSEEVETVETPATIGPGVVADLGTAPDRPRRRMDIDQLDRSIRAVTGGIGWEDGSGRNQFERYASTLGVPDYQQNTIEDRDASVIFLKFLDDAARSVCRRLMTREEEGTEERTFLVHATPEDVLPAGRSAIDQNLAYLLLRFHGKMIEPSSPEIERWRTAFERSSADPMGGDPSAMRGWNAVCVALVNHPDFYTY
jgi:hypothetical protein